MVKLLLLFTVSVLLCSSAYAANSVNPVISGANLKKMFDSVMPYADISSAFHSFMGRRLLGETITAQSQQELCTLVKTKVEKDSLESIYYAYSISTSISNCQLTASDYQATLTAGSNSAKVTDIYYYVFTSAILKTPIDSKKIAKNLVDGLKADSSILNQAFSLHIATQLADPEAKKFYDNIEDILEQADEVDKKFMQYEGGVGTTGLVIEGIILLSEKVNHFTPKFDQQRLIKFTNYILSKRNPTNVKSAFYLLRSAMKLSDNKYAVPMIANRVSPVGLNPIQAKLIVSLTSLMGTPLKQKLNMEAESVKTEKKNVLFAAKKQFTSKSSDGTLFELNLIEPNQEIAADYYTLVLAVLPKSAQFVLINNQVEVKVTTPVNVVDLQIGVADREQSAPKLTKLEENTKLKSKLDADMQSKLYLRFTVKDKKKNNVEAHQAFVRFTEVKTGREIVFLAQTTTTVLYNADIDFSTNAKNFRFNSGDYLIELLISDSLIENPVAWKLADIRLNFNEELAHSGLDKAEQYAAKPEIKHLFKEPEATPPKIVSLVFTGLCVAPLVVLIIMWLRIGFNFSKFSFSLYSLVFHVSLAALFGLFYCYWIQLNMFQTLRYLAVLAIIIFLSGNRLLKSLSSKN